MVLRKIFSSLLLTALAALVVFADTTAAFADQAERERQAEEHFQQGAEAYFRGDFPAAIIEFRRGHTLSPNAVFLYNLSLSFARLGNEAEALNYAVQSRELGLTRPDIALDPDTGLRNDTRIAAFIVSLSAQAVVQDIRKGGQQGCQSNADCGAGQYCNQRTNMCEAVQATGDGRFGPFGPVGWVGAGLGVAGVGFMVGALLVNVGLNSDIRDYEEKLANDEEDEELRRDIERRQATGRTLLFVGVGAGAVGAGLMVYDVFFTDRQASALQLTPTNDGIYVSFTRDF